MLKSEQMDLQNKTILVTGADGFRKLVKCDDSIDKEVNITSNFEISISDTLKYIKKLIKSNVEFIIDEKRIRPEKSEVFRLWGDNTLIKGLTGFKPSYTIIEDLSETIEWFLNTENL